MQSKNEANIQPSWQNKLGLEMIYLKLSRMTYLFPSAGKGSNLVAWRQLFRELFRHVLGPTFDAQLNLITHLGTDWIFSIPLAIIPRYFWPFGRQFIWPLNKLCPETSSAFLYYAQDLLAFSVLTNAFKRDFKIADCRNFFWDHFLKGLDNRLN